MHPSGHRNSSQLNGVTPLPKQEGTRYFDPKKKRELRFYGDEITGEFVLTAKGISQEIRLSPDSDFREGIGKLRKYTELESWAIGGAEYAFNDWKEEGRKEYERKKARRLRVEIGRMVEDYINLCPKEGLEILRNETRDFLKTMQSLIGEAIEKQAVTA